MVQDCAAPERIIIAHPFNPPHLAALPEVDAVEQVTWPLAGLAAVPV
jgi:3-hydroxyacyl-CoA dehydrogenase